MTPSTILHLLRLLHVTERSYWTTPTPKSTIHGSARTEKALEKYNLLILEAGRPLNIEELALASGNTKETVSAFFLKYLENYDVTIGTVDTERGPRSVRSFWPSGVEKTGD